MSDVGDPDSNTRRVEFHGRAGEFFGIWIVNILLTIITLGIYNAWAFVKTTRYFYANTVIDGDRLEYHATGFMIFKGQILIVLAIIIFNLISLIGSSAVFIASLGIFFALPWAVNSAMSFRCRMTSWRNIHLAWHGRYWDSFLTIYVYPLIGLLTLTLLMPFATRRNYTFFLGNTAVGTRRLSTSPSIGPFYLGYMITSVAFVISAVLVGSVVFRPLLRALEVWQDGFSEAAIENLVVPVFVGVFGIGILSSIGGIIATTIVRNAVINDLQLDGVARFRSDLHPLKLLFVVVTNFLMTVFSIGLLTPLAKVRYHRALYTTITAELEPKGREILQAAGRGGTAFAQETGVLADFGLNP